MAGLFPSLTYVTLQELTDTTNVAALKSAGDPEKTRYIAEAETLIDAYVGYIKPAMKGQYRKFPTLDKFGVSIIPNDIKLATVYIAESLFIAGAPSTSNVGSVIRETVGDHSIQYAEKTDSASIPEKAKVLLNRFRSTFVGRQI